MTAGVVLDPMVIKIKPIANWGTPNKKENQISLAVIIKESINNLDKADKNLKGLIDGDPWIKAKDVVLELST